MRSGIAMLAMVAGAAADGAHPEHLAQIEQIRSIPGVLWEARPNSLFSMDPLNASTSRLGLMDEWVQELENAIAQGDVVRWSSSSDLGASQDPPESFDSAINWPECAKIIHDIRNQGSCGSCWAFAGTAAASDRMCIATHGKIIEPLSTQNTAFCASRDGCSGGYIQQVWQYIQMNGAVTGGQPGGNGPFGTGLCSNYNLGAAHAPGSNSPMCPSTCDVAAEPPHNNFKMDEYIFYGSVMSAHGEIDIMKAIAVGGPVETGFIVYSDFFSYHGGIYHHVTGGARGGHAVKIVGWGSENGNKYWKIANSWGLGWGEGGFFRMKRGNNECGIESSVAFSSPDAQWEKKASIHPEHLAQIEQIRKTPGVEWEARPNSLFSSDPLNASTSRLGLMDEWVQELENAIAQGDVVRWSSSDLGASQDPPESFDSAINWPECAGIIHDIRNQGSCGSCWAFAGTAAASDRMCIATHGKIVEPLSTQNTAFCASRDGCSGGYIQQVWQYIQMNGAVTGGQPGGNGPFGTGLCSNYNLGAAHAPGSNSPMCPSTCDVAAKPPHNNFGMDKYIFYGSVMSAHGEIDIMKAIAVGGPVETGFTVYSDFFSYHGGIYHHVTGGVRGGHAVKIAGWGSENGNKYWKIANSWGLNWGEGGFFRMKRGTNECGIESSVAFSSPDAQWEKKASFDAPMSAGFLAFTTSLAWMFFALAFEHTVLSK